MEEKSFPGTADYTPSQNIERPLEDKGLNLTLIILRLPLIYNENLLI